MQILLKFPKSKKKKSDELFYNPRKLRGKT